LESESDHNIQQVTGRPYVVTRYTLTERRRTRVDTTHSQEDGGCCLKIEEWYRETAEKFTFASSQNQRKRNERDIRGDHTKHT